MTLQNNFGQSNLLLTQINVLNKVSNIPFDNSKNPWQDCGDEIIWTIAVQGESAIEPLIKKIADTSFTNLYFKDYSNKIRLRVGDIAYITLEQILFIPTFTIANVQFDVGIYGGYQSGFFEYLNSFSNRIKFQKQLDNYYRTNKFKLVLFNKNEMQIKACAISHNIKGRFDK